MATTDSSRTLVAIPARWGSTRFPGKPLHLIAGKPLVQHVWERCQECKQIDDVIIATDDIRIAEAAAAFGAKFVLTAPEHPSGTDRIAEAANSFPDHRVIINVQGDEPLISPALIDELARTLRDDPSVKMITAAAPIHDAAQISDPNVVKVIFDKKTGQLLGAHMIGAEVTELIQGYVVAMNLETTEEELMHTVFPHPTLSEMMKEAVLDAYGRVLNI